MKFIRDDDLDSSFWVWFIKLAHLLNVYRKRIGVRTRTWWEIKGSKDVNLWEFVLG